MKYTILTQKDFTLATMSEAKQVEFINNFPLAAINKIKARVAEIKSIKSKDRNFENTVLAYENISDEEEIVMGNIHNLEMCSEREKVRDSARKAEVAISSALVDIVYDINLYKSIKDYYDNNYKKEAESLDSQDIKLIEDMMRDFARMGFDLDIKSRNKIKQIEKKISKLATEYDANISKDKSHIVCSLEDLAGVPENIIASFAKVETKKEDKNKKPSKVVEDKYKVTVDYPEYGPYMKYATNREKREELYILFNNVGGVKNVKILEELVVLRHEKSQILGHANHGEYVTSERMAKSTKNPYKMLNDILSKIKGKKEEEVKEVIAKAAEDNLKEKDFKNSDFDYYINKIRQEKYVYDEQKIREYFPLDHVLSSMFELFGDLFGFEIRESNIKLWHKDAKMYELIDNAKNKNYKESKVAKVESVIGYMAMDLFPREGKFGHACMSPTIIGKEIIDSKKQEKMYRSGFVTLVCNFSKPQKIKKNKDTKGNTPADLPSLLTIDEVETLYHEFGHGIHALLSKAKHNSHSGTNVVWDFVETPSQIMEEWVTEEKVLSKISKHYATGKSLPKVEIEKIKSLGKFMKGLFYSRQCMQSILDLDIYTGKLGSKSIVEHYHTLRKKHTREELKSVIFVSKFAHIARGYDAGYYSYIWAERISKDIYSEFTNRQYHKNSNGKYKVGDYKSFGLNYRKEILEMGSSRDENKSVEKLLGRAIDNEGFIKSIL